MHIDGGAYTHNNIAGFINNGKGRNHTIRPNSQFVEVINEEDGDMEREVDRLIMAEVITGLTIRDQLLINYNFVKCTLVQKKREEKVLTKDVIKGRKPKNNK